MRLRIMRQGLEGEIEMNRMHELEQYVIQEKLSNPHKMLEEILEEIAKWNHHGLAYEAKQALMELP